jgi:hypothetical protein
MVADPIFAGGADMFTLLTGAILVLLGGTSNALPLATIMVAALIL